MALVAFEGADEDVQRFSVMLYAACQTKESGQLFTQDELISLGVIPEGNLALLTKCLNSLGSDGLFKLMIKDSRPCWKAVSKEDAAKYRNLSTEEAIVFSYIESAGREGIWTKTIRNKSNLHQIVFTRCLKSLESKGLIKPTQNARFTNRKLFILSTLQPSEEVSGGPFYSDGILDEEYISQLCSFVEKYVLGRSWYHPPNKFAKKRRSGKPTTEEAIALREQELKYAVRDGSLKMVPMPPGYIGYPTVPEITKALNEDGLSSLVLKEAEVRQMLQVLSWDGRVEEVIGGRGFRSIRSAWPGDDEDLENAFTESPCGRCPIFELCEEGGPVNARSCIYFQHWLEI